MDGSSAEDALEDFARLLRRASQRLDEAITARLGEPTVARWHVLAALGGGTGLSMSELAELTPLTGASLTRLIDAMVSDNLVHRKVDPLDRRRVLVSRTRRGTLAYQKMRRSLEGSALETIPAARPQLIGELTTLLDFLGAEHSTAATGATRPTG
ncbi:MarR family winged helix-turn-helix transcriptional regulator [Nocardia africana]|uniref:Homoprotocatechuate degradation operon regulator, HpaR n=1 Tax=Nocardia africana TaxID=134964 RepID=A0A378WPB2_9NOCA|nr:MarR family transcriptional regulator [Nocardia africana]MCC3314708.1 MarR family transcriptional regulator [Nocardia africana]SUA43009.1 homoprotocatechuate degradation operon regulator, HpaR [Nocardia africana]